MSIAELKALVPPPKSPFETGTSSLWKKLDKLLGLKLPQDYRDFVTTYGTGLFAGLYRVYNPFSAMEYMSLLTCIERDCKNARQMKKAGVFNSSSYPIYPETGGILPWGNDENGNFYYWLTKGSPTKWSVVQNSVRGDGFRVHSCTMTGFLVAILRREIKPLASRYPRKDAYKFEPWNPDTTA